MSSNSFQAPVRPTMPTYKIDRLRKFSGGSRISRRGREPRKGVVDSVVGYISKILYVETKESGPLGGPCAGTPPRSANEIDYL